MPNASATRSRDERPTVQPFDYLGFYRTPTIERVAFMKAGFSAKKAKLFLSRMLVDQKTMYRALNIKTATLNKKSSEDKDLPLDEVERILGLAKLLGQLEAMLQESGDAEGFDAQAWLSRWLSEPVPALKGAPIDFLDTMEGQALVAQTLAQMQSGAYA